ncbi:GtrA family protein [Rhodovastum sp. RN2-1]|uniref:GtrA family protein n=2 Tax=Limobrevibacterium gyesilva TaxID=2991712 RepID=A0AA42CG85_9PROT|nr:GtrA family protein [Limobrevibacterium gyesilva]
MQAILLRVMTPSRVALLQQFLRFGTVGFIGFLVDTAVVYALKGSLGLYAAGLASYLVAATTTWGLNRLWTFRGRGSGPVHRQWALFLSANAIGFVLNRGTYFALVTFSPVCIEHPVLAILAGVAMGMFLNFHLSRTVVFR